MEPKDINAAIAKKVGTDNLWLVKKQGYYWRPNSAGYTDNIDHAGRYTEEEAKAREYKHGNGCEWVTIEPAPLPNYYEDLNLIVPIVRALPDAEFHTFALVGAGMTHDQYGSGTDTLMSRYRDHFAPTAALLCENYLRLFNLYYN